MTDRFVDAHDGIRLAVRDHGGDGPPMIFMHGAGMHLLSLENLVAQLPDFRVVTMDVRWCGQSGDSPTYDWGDLVRDVESVANGLDLGNPIVAGHSWGGMIAAHYGVDHPDAPAVINLDGHGSGNASLFDGMTAEEHAAGMAMIESINEGMLPKETSGDDAWHETALAQAIETSRFLGVPEDRLVEFAERGFVCGDDGTWEARPSPVMMTGLKGDLGLLDVYATVRCPLQIFNCTKTQPGLPPEIDAFMSAYRRGLGRALDELAAAHPNIEISRHDEIDHISIVQHHAPVIADAMRSFIASARRTSP